VKPSRSYRPTVEALEALRLLSDAAQAIPGLPLAHDVLTGPSSLGPDVETNGVWDEALTQAHIADILAPFLAVPTLDPPAPSNVSVLTPAGTVSTPTQRDVASGIEQLNRYLSRAWSRAGVPQQLHDDSTQAVYVSLLQNLGSSRFESLLGDIGRNGVRDVLSRETPEGPDFFRAVDTVKKRAQREKTFQPLDTVDVAAADPGEDALGLWRGALQEAIDQTLTPREASLVYDTLKGMTPAEIAASWGVAPKTVSNEKTRALQKLRDALTSELSD
jgi:DNA-directed RNA polymerase specialized sigma24 family protein